MLDVHTHILPGMDDGSKNIRQSLAMLHRERKQGVSDVILTPHFYASQESPQKFLHRRAEAVSVLAEAAGAAKDLPRLHLGAEVAYFTGMSRTDEIFSLCIGNTRCILIEMPFDKWNRRVLDEVFFLRECQGIQPILAHVERYLHFQPMGTVGRLCEAGIWMQTNASFFLKAPASWLATHMLKKQHIHFVASDCHNMKERPVNVGLAMAEIDRKIGRPARRHLALMEKRLLEGIM